MDTFTPTKELDRRDRVGEDVRAAGCAGDTILRIARMALDATPPDSPVCLVLEDLLAALQDEVLPEFQCALSNIEGGRYSAYLEHRGGKP